MKMRSTLIKTQARNEQETESGTVRYTHDCRKYFMSSVDDNNKIVITKSLPSSTSLLLSIPYALQHFINSTQYGSVYSTYAAANRL